MHRTAVLVVLLTLAAILSAPHAAGQGGPMQPQWVFIETFDGPATDSNTRPLLGMAPANRWGTWTSQGGQSFEVDADSHLDLRKPLQTGQLVQVVLERTIAGTRVVALATTDVHRSSINDGPHVLHQPDGSVRAMWCVAGQLHTRTFAAGAPIRLPEFDWLLGADFKLTDNVNEPSVVDLPERVLVISDVEGEYDSMVRFLRGNGVIDDSNRWAYGKGHLVCIGDMVDRGDRVTETLWLLYRLADEAKKAGGHLHYVLGNHEAMIMGDDIRYIADKYRGVVQLTGIAYPQLVGPDMELGRWLRTRNALLRIGAYLFVHAGISPALARAAPNIQELNDRIRPVLGTLREDIEEPLTQAIVWGRPGPFWYRGYFTKYAMDFGPKPTSTELDVIMETYSARTMMIGHTKVPTVTPMFGDHRVIAIDTPWTDLPNVRGVLIEGDVMFAVDVNGHREQLVDPSQ